MIAASATAGCETAMFSSAIELIHSPPRFDDVLGAIDDLGAAVRVDGADVAGP